MPIALWCLFIAALMPYFISPLARGKTVSNANPRVDYAMLTGFQQRAYAAHLNSFEAFPYFAAAVIIALGSVGPNFWLDTLAMLFIALRVLYVVCYLKGWSTARSSVFLAGLIVVGTIFTMPAWWF